MQADRYSTEHARRAGLEVQEYINGAHFTGTADALIAADLIEADHLPQGAKRVSDWHDSDGNWLTLRKVKGGRLTLSVHLGVSYCEWRRKAALADSWVAGLPGSEEAFRQHLRRCAGSVVELFKRAATRPNGGYRLAASEDELLAAFAGVVELIESAPVQFSAQERAQQIREYRGEAAVLEPRYRQFRDSLLSAEVPDA